MVSISGIRGIVGTDLTPEVAVKYASAFAEYCNRGTIVLGRDGRVTGKILGNIISSTLLSMGCDVIALGICPTPTVQLAVERLRAAGGISITASHNPIEWNGMKFIAPTGLFLDEEENKKLWALAEKSSRSYARWNRQGKHQTNSEMVEFHIREVTSIPFLDVQTIRRRKFKVVVDCVNGAGGVVVPQLLRTLGCEVVEMNCDASGLFAHTPEPIPENLSDLCQRVRQEGAHLGIAVDPDADRLVLINEKGEPFGEEYTIASVVKFVLEKEARRQTGEGKQRSVVVNLSTTRAVDDIAKHYGARVYRTPVGEINVAKKMKEVGAVVGGEGSGGVILPSVHVGRDSLVGIGLVLQFLAEFGGPMSELKKTLPQYEITKGKIEIGSKNPDTVLRRLEGTFAFEGPMTNTDGLKIDFPDSWVHLRKSNTEPIIRIIAEAPTKEKANELVNKFTSAIQKEL
ncbi:MAG TPA: phosphoglucosamine mutase [Bacteroidota bacterium]|nr:phosphoglucosamine mutase [Bacteroidota bacterium]